MLKRLSNYNVSPSCRNATTHNLDHIMVKTKSARGMPWHWEPMKDVAIYDKPRLVESRHLTRGFPNGATRQSNTLSTYGE